MLSRREFLNFSAATIALTSLPNQIQSNQLIRNYKLTAGITPHLFDKKGVSDNPGKWLFHCDMLEHAASGMIGYIEVL